MSDHDLDDLDDEDVDTVTVDLAPDLAQRLVEAKEALDEVKEYYEGLRQEVLTVLQGQGERVHGVAFGGTVCTYSRYHTSRLNGRKLKREFPDIYAQYVSQSSHDRLTFPKAVSG